MYTYLQCIRLSCATLFYPRVIFLLIYLWHRLRPRLSFAKLCVYLALLCVLIGEPPSGKPECSKRKLNLNAKKRQVDAEFRKEKRSTVNCLFLHYCSQNLKFHVTDGSTGNNDTCRASTFSVLSYALPSWS